MNDIILISVNDGLDLFLGFNSEKLRLPLYGFQNCLVPLNIGYRVPPTARFIGEICSDLIQIKGVEKQFKGRYFLYSDFTAIYMQNKMRL